jgi:transmembrane sensor
MGILEIRETLMKYRLNNATGDDLSKLWGWFANKKNEQLIKDLLLDDLNKFEAIRSEKVKPNFNGIFTAIQLKIEENSTEGSDVNPLQQTGLFYFIRIAALFILIFFCGGIISYFVFDKKELADTVAYNEIKAPLGARSEVVLPDGSKVWLNAGSVLRYQTSFNKANRCVTLQGEAYFMVSKNKHLPFNVKTEDLNIVAVGTQFNVKAYEDEGTVETTLVEGRVSIRQNNKFKQKTEAIYLAPYQKAVYFKDFQELKVESTIKTKEEKPVEVLNYKQGIMYVTDKVDPLPIISWKENRLVFKSEELSSLLTKLERKYDVTFTYNMESLKSLRFSGTLENETLTQVLDVIKLSAPIEYVLDGKTVRITENKQMSKKFSGHLKKNK